MIENKVAIVTGASRGIGNAIAAKLANEGYAIVAVGTSEEQSISANLDAIRQHGTPVAYGTEYANNQEPRRLWLSARVDF